MNEQPERFTNDWQQVILEIDAQMTTVDKTAAGTTQLIYMERSLTGHASIHYIKGEENRLVVRIWNQADDYYNFPTRFYNLDRLSILKKTVTVRTKEAERIEQLSFTKPVIAKFKGITFDGIDVYLANYRFQPVLINKWSGSDTPDASTADLIRTLKIIAMPAHPFKF